MYGDALCDYIKKHSYFFFIISNISPGYFANLEQYNLEGSVITKHLSKYMHFLDPNVLSRVFQQMGFEICKSKFLNRQGYPPHIRLDGCESVGVIAQKP